MKFSITGQEIGDLLIQVTSNYKPNNTDVGLSPTTHLKC
jgi:hypothetical protein